MWLAMFYTQPFLIEKHKNVSSHSGVHMTAPLSFAPDDTRGSQVIPKLVNLCKDKKLHMLFSQKLKALKLTVKLKVAFYHLSTTVAKNDFFCFVKAHLRIYKMPLVVIKTSSTKVTVI